MAHTKTTTYTVARMTTMKTNHLSDLTLLAAIARPFFIFVVSFFSAIPTQRLGIWLIWIMDIAPHPTIFAPFNDTDQPHQLMGCCIACHG